jgi:hypothetical protein
LFEKLIDSWSEKEIFQLQADIITSFLGSDTSQSIETSIEFAKYLHYRKLDDKNYPFFLELLLHKNFEVVDALIGDGTPLLAFKNLQRNRVLVQTVFEMLKRLTVKAYHKTLETLFGVLYMNYHQPVKGWELYAPSVEELNYVGKYLDKSKPQSDKINRIVLDILADIGELSSQKSEDEEVERVGAHANKIRNVYFDNREQMDKVIPPNIHN